MIKYVINGNFDGEMVDIKYSSLIGFWPWFKGAKIVFQLDTYVIENVSA